MKNLIKNLQKNGIKLMPKIMKKRWEKTPKNSSLFKSWNFKKDLIQRKLAFSFLTQKHLIELWGKKHLQKDQTAKTKPKQKKLSKFETILGYVCRPTFCTALLMR
jgi:hypothetical protein